MRKAAARLLKVAAVIGLMALTIGATGNPDPGRTGPANNGGTSGPASGNGSNGTSPGSGYSR